MEDRLQKFAALIDAGSYTQAAQALHISQPALTTAIQKLERELTAELIVPGSRPIQPTKAGQLAYQAALDLKLQTNNLQGRVAQVANQPATIALGMIDSIADVLFVQDSAFWRLRKNAAISVSVHNSTQLLTMVERGELDSAFMVKPVRLPASLDEVTLGTEPLVLVLAPSLQQSTLMHLSKARRLPNFLSYNKGSATQALITEHFARQNISLEAIFYSTSPHIMLELALDGRGCAVLPYFLVLPYLKSGTLALVADQGVINRPISVVGRKTQHIPLVLGSITEHVSKLLAQLHQEATAHMPAAPAPGNQSATRQIADA